MVPQQMRMHIFGRASTSLMKQAEEKAWGRIWGYLEVALLEYSAHVLHIMVHNLFQKWDEIQKRLVFVGAEERLDRDSILRLQKKHTVHCACNNKKCLPK
jgi:hypothetical protein